MPALTFEPSVAPHPRVALCAQSGELLFYWIDAFDYEGTIFLFGRAKITDQYKTVSSCLVVNGVERNVFVLPRPFMLADADVRPAWRIPCLVLACLCGG